MLEPRPPYEIVPYADDQAPAEIVPATSRVWRPSALATLAAGLIWLVRELGPELVRAWPRLQATADASRLAPATLERDLEPAVGRRMRRRHGRQS
jgi:hypothetical protein